MNFDLHSPCKTCPFIKNGVRGHNPVRHLRRAREIAANMASPDGESFACHMTVDYVHDDEGAITGGSQHCAGALLFMEKVNIHGTQCARIAERLKIYDRKKYRGSELVFDSVAAMARANQER